MNRVVINAEGVHIGWLEDFLIDKDSRKVTDMIINAENHRGERAPYVSLPYRTLGFGPFGILYDVRVDEVRGMPGYIYED